MCLSGLLWKAKAVFFNLKSLVFCWEKHSRVQAEGQGEPTDSLDCPEAFIGQGAVKNGLGQTSPGWEISFLTGVLPAPDSCESLSGLAEDCVIRAP